MAGMSLAGLLYQTLSSVRSAVDQLHCLTSMQLINFKTVVPLKFQHVIICTKAHDHTPQL